MTACVAAGVAVASGGPAVAGSKFLVRRRAIRFGSWVDAEFESPKLEEMPGGDFVVLIDERLMWEAGAAAAMRGGWFWATGRGAARRQSAALKFRYCSPLGISRGGFAHSAVAGLSNWTPVACGCCLCPGTWRRTAASWRHPGASVIRNLHSCYTRIGGRPPNS